MEHQRLHRLAATDDDLDHEAVSSPSAPPVSRFERSSRSALTNGTLLVANADKRAPWVRRFRDVVHLLEDHLGGPEAVSEVHRSLIKRAAALTVESERMETKFANSDEVDPSALDVYLRTCGHLHRILSSLGLDKKAGTGTPASLDAHAYNTRRLLDALAQESD